MQIWKAPNKTIGKNTIVIVDNVLPRMPMVEAKLLKKYKILHTKALDTLKKIWFSYLN